MTSVLGKRTHEPTFQPVKDWIDALVLKIDEIPDNQIAIKLEPKQCTRSDVPQTYLCVICHCVSWIPMECIDCDQVACYNCIIQWNQRSPNCPTCRNQSGYKNLNRHLKNTIEELNFKCSIRNCSTTFKYADAFQHIKLCQIPTSNCLSECGSPSVFKGRNAMRDHFQQNCDKAVMQCEDCDE